MVIVRDVLMDQRSLPMVEDVNCHFHRGNVKEIIINKEIAPVNFAQIT